MTLEARLKEIRERAVTIATIEAERHYSLESGCDSWVKLKAAYQAQWSDVGYLLGVIEKMRRHLVELARYDIDPKYLANGHGEVARQACLASLDAESEGR